MNGGGGCRAERQQGTPVTMGRTYIRPDRDNTQYRYINKTANRSKTYSNDDRTFACELNYGHSQAALTNPHRKPLPPLGQPQGSHGHQRSGMGSRRHRQGPPRQLGEGVAKPASGLPDPRKVLWQQKRSATFNKPSNRLADRALLGRSGSFRQLDGERIGRVRGGRG